MSVAESELMLLKDRNFDFTPIIGDIAGRWGNPSLDLVVEVGQSTYRRSDPWTSHTLHDVPLSYCVGYSV